MKAVAFLGGDEGGCVRRSVFMEPDRVSIKAVRKSIYPAGRHLAHEHADLTGRGDEGLARLFRIQRPLDAVPAF